MTAALSLEIDEEFRALIPPLRADELARLEASLIDEGCRESLTAWRNGKLLLIDGHHRREICDRHGIVYAVAEKEFPNREAVKLWIEETQLGRRNLTEDQRSAIAYRVQQRRSEASKKTRSDAANAVRHNKMVSSEDTASPKEKPRTRSAVAREAKVPERKLRAIAAVAKAKPALVEKIASGKVTVKEATREVRREEKQQQRETAAREASVIVADNDHGVRLGDFRKVAESITDASVDLIFTDPPYDRKTLPLYGDLALAARRVLKPGGSLICYLGQYQIDEVCQLMTPHVRLWWTLACIHTGTSARMTEYGIVVKWKPMLWFVKGTRGDKQTFVEDAIQSEMQKDAHDWQQGLIEARYYIEQLTLPGQLVFDPFCGGGTTAVAAKTTKRRWLTCDVDEVAAQIARKRIHDAQV